MAVVRSPDFLRALIRETALSTLIRQRHLTPSCGGHAPTAERTVGPARMIAESLTPKPGIRERSATKRTPPALPEIGREASATVCAPLVVSLPWRVTARCPIVDPDLPPGRSAIPVLVAAMVLTARRLLRFLVLERSNSVLRPRPVGGRDRCLAGPRRVALGASAGGEKRRIDAARRWSGAAADSNGSDCWAIVRHPNHAQLAQLDRNTVAFGLGFADAGRLVRGG